jgi:amidase
MSLLEPGFVAAAPAAWRVGRVRVDADPKIDAAIDRALAATGWEVVDIQMPEWESVSLTGGLLLLAEAWNTNRVLAESRPEGIGRDVLDRLHLGRDASDQVSLSAARTARSLWVSRINGMFKQVDLLAMPTLTILPPLIEDSNDLLVARCTLPVNLAGLPALALPVRTEGHLPASLQLVGQSNGEDTLIAAGLIAEAANAA